MQRGKCWCVKKKYRLVADDAVHPYITTGHVGDNLSSLLSLVEYPDVFNFLFTTRSPVTKDELKAFKSLEGYKLLIAGWVGSIAADEVTANEPEIMKFKALSGCLTASSLSLGCC